MKNSYPADTLESMGKAAWYNQWIISKFEKFLQGDILEVGCGIGNFTSSLTKYGSVWAVDINKDYIAQTKVAVNGKAKAGKGDIAKGKYFFGNLKFDSIVCLNVLEHIKDDQAALDNLFKLLKIRGKLILLVPSHNFLYGAIDKSINHFRRYEKFQVCKKLKETGFGVIKCSRLNILGAIGWFIAGKILKHDLVKEGSVKMFNVVAPLILRFEDLVEPPIGTSILVIAEKND